MKLSLPAMLTGSAVGPAGASEDAGAALSAAFGGGDDATLRSMDEALAFASLLLQAGDAAPGTPLPAPAEPGGKILPPVLPAADGEATPTPAPVDDEALAALVSLLGAPGETAGDAGANPPPPAVGAPAVKPPAAVPAPPAPAAPAAQGAASAPVPRVLTEPPLRSGGVVAQPGSAADSAAADGAKSLDRAAEIAAWRPEDAAGDELPLRQQRQRMVADVANAAALRGAEPPSTTAEPASRAGADVRALNAALLSAAPAQQPVLEPPAASADRALVTVRSPLGGEQWANSFAERVGWVVNQRLGSAEVRLNPAHLGPVEVSITVDDEQARVVFSATHAATREAIEQAVPRLREMLAQQGLDLRQADVGAFTAGDDRGARSGNAAGRDGDPGAAAASDGDAASAADAESVHDDASRMRLSGGRLIDTFV